MNPSPRTLNDKINKSELAKALYRKAATDREQNEIERQRYRTGVITTTKRKENRGK